MHCKRKTERERASEEEEISTYALKSTINQCIENADLCFENCAFIIKNLSSLLIVDVNCKWRHFINKKKLKINKF